MPCPEVINEARNSLPTMVEKGGVCMSLICHKMFLFPVKIINDFSTTIIKKLWFCDLGRYISPAADLS